MKHRYIFGIGTNLGEKRMNLSHAVVELRKIASFIKISRIYKTKSILEGQEDYYNQVVEIASNMRPESFLEHIKKIEKRLGRVDNGRWQPRIIDIDIIDYDGNVYDSNKVSIPHKEMSKRSFVLYPLRELMPDYIHPVSGLTIDEMIANLEDDLDIVEL